MKKAIIQTGGKQYVELLKDAGKSVSFEPLLVIDGEKTQVGTPALGGVKVTADVVEADKQADKVTSIRYKPKKRVRTVKGHRQHQTILKITKIA
jgi:large subunit ribosomal protein L21